MKMPPSDPKPLREMLGTTSGCSGRYLEGVTGKVALSDVLGGSSFGGQLSALSGRSVLLATRNPLAAALALIELDGVARRIVLCPPDLPTLHLPSIIAKAEVDAIVSDDSTSAFAGPDVLHINNHPCIAVGGLAEAARFPTQWVLLTSGTTGVPKMLAHNLAGLTGAIQVGVKPETPMVWSTFFDLRRFGGLQIFFRAILCGGSLVLSDREEPFENVLRRLSLHEATHVHGTPTHWRRVLMSPLARAIRPRYIRLSGEIADQAILDNLRASYPNADIVHAYASTEAGVGFEVADGLEGFPASLLGSAYPVELRIDGASLRIRSSRTALDYIGEDGPQLKDAEGFVDTGDIVERRGDR